MNLGDFLFEAADGLKRGDHFDLETVEEAVEQMLDHLELACDQIEEEELPDGLESLEQAFFEAARLFSESADMLLLAVSEDIPELHTYVSSRAQDAIDTLRAIRQTVETQNSILVEELRGAE